ncbi:MAG: autotransporter-associated beta strand repeat-containing protein, partial [Gaiellales bacterium]
MCRLRLIATGVLTLIALAIGALAAEPSADAATFDRDPSSRTLTVTVDSNGEAVTLSATATDFVVTWQTNFSTPATNAFTKTDFDSIIIDGNDRANVRVTLDGEGTDLSVRTGLTVKNLFADDSSQVSVKGAIGISGLAGHDRTLELDSPAASADRERALILLVAPTTFTLAAPPTGHSSTVRFGGRVLGNQALSIQLPGGTNEARQVTFLAPVGVPTSGDPSRVASLTVDAGRVILPSVVSTVDFQQWGSAELVLPEADAALRASRVLGTGQIGCDPQTLSSTGCATAATLTIDVTAIRAGADLGSSIGGVGSSQYGDPGAPEQRIHLVKEGVGTLSFNAAGYRNRHSGGTTITEGTLRVGHANALGTGGTIVGATGTLELSDGFDEHVSGQTTYPPSSLGLAGTITSSGSANHLRTPITLLGDATIATSTALVVFSNVAGGSHDLTVSGLVDFAGTIDTTGAVRVAPSTTWVTSTSLAATGSLTVDGNLDLDPGGLAPYTTTLAAARLNGTGAIRCDNGAYCNIVVIDVSDTSGVTAFSGGFGGISGTYPNLTVRKAGAGTLVLAGTSQITGNTIVAAGELRVTPSGSIGGGLSAGTVTVEAGARVSGSGAVGGGDDAGGVGQSVAGTIDLDGPTGPETMTTSSLNLVGGVLDVGVDDTSTHSQLQVANFVTLSAGAALRVRAGSALTEGTT